MRLVDVMVRYRDGLRAQKGVVALADVSLRVDAGEKLGVIGGNGAGKSTLLRVMAGVLSVDEGVCDAEGASTALLSLNAGLDIDLSGARNVVMYGMLTGLTRAEAASRVPEVVEMSGLKDAIDRRVSTYSTGMRARLGFWTAMNLAPDVLLVDEVLSVGDREFRERSRQAMVNRFEGDRTVVLATHNVGFAGDMCDRVVWLDHGRVRMDGAAKDVVRAYKGAGGKAIVVAKGRGKKAASSTTRSSDAAPVPKEPAVPKERPVPQVRSVPKHLFVCGAAGCGGSDVANLLNTHPAVVLGLERYSRIFSRAETRDDWQTLFDSERFLSPAPGDSDEAPPLLPDEANALERKFGEAAYVGDKVDSLYARLDFLRDTYPECTAIQVVRDPVFAVTAWLRGREAMVPGQDAAPLANELKDEADDLVGRWNESVTSAFAARKRFGRRFVCVSYDRLFGSSRHRSYRDLLRVLRLHPAWSETSSACLEETAARMKADRNVPAGLRSRVERIADFRRYSKLLHLAV